MEEENLEGFAVIPQSERVEHVKQDCDHKEAVITETRSDGLIDVFCPTCNTGCICKSIKEFRK